MSQLERMTITAVGYTPAGKKNPGSKRLQWYHVHEYEHILGRFKQCDNEHDDSGYVQVQLMMIALNYRWDTREDE